MMNKNVPNPYRLLGIILAASGAILTPLFYFVVGSVPLAAAGLSAILVGATSVAIANARPYISPEACQMLLKTGMENTGALLEELGLRNKAIYLPAAMMSGQAQAIIPLMENWDIQNIKQKLPGRMIVRCGINSEDMAIAVTTPGNVNLNLLAVKPGPTADAIESALSYILIGVLDISSSVTVKLVDSRVEVEVSGAKMQYDDTWYYRCLGSPIASTAAAISSEALGKPVRIGNESYSKKKGHITIEVMS